MYPVINPYGSNIIGIIFFIYIMIIWKYKESWYKAISIPNNLELNQETIVYVPKWDKCYYLHILGKHGNGSREKAFIEDIYTGKQCWIESKWIKLVVKWQQ